MNNAVVFWIPNRPSSLMKNILHTSLLVLPVLLGYSVGTYVFSDDSPGAQQLSISHTGNTPHLPGLPSVWNGRNISELVATLGEPDVILEKVVRDIVVYGDTHTVIYVYSPTSGSGNQDYEAYVVEHDNGKVLAHQHR